MIQDDFSKASLISGAIPQHIIGAVVDHLLSLSSWFSLNSCQTLWFVKKPCTCQYAYSRYKIPCRPFPPILQAVVEIVEKILNIKGFNAINVNSYSDGDSSLGYHSDKEALFQATKQKACIVSISFGATRTFAIRNVKSGTEKIVALKHGDILTMEGWFQKFFEHSILKDSQVVEQRFNLTLRKIVQHESSCTLAKS